ncbi:MAG: ROK family protein [Oscillospiraceae bacterium]|nr:ROK family protein [Oscillospiraceae bacterium]
MNGKTTEPGVLMVVDIGGSKYMPGFLDTEGKILYQESRSWTGDSPEEIMEQIISALHHISRLHPQLAEQAVAGGLTIPGFADPVTGDWVDSDVPVIRGLPICRLLEEEFHIPFYADNDCNACALAEAYFGTAKGSDHFLYMTVSTGIGGAMYLNGALHYGAFYHGGEIGLCVTTPGGRPTDSGSCRGVVEMYGSTRGMRQTFIELGGASLVDGKEPGGLEISRLADEGCPAAQKAIELEGRQLGRVIGNTAVLMDCDRVIVGGGISLMFQRYRPWLEEEFRHIRPEGQVVIGPTELGYSGAFLGAGAAALRGLAGFQGSPGSGSVEGCVLRVRLEGEEISARLLLEGREYKGASGRAMDFASFLISSGVTDPGVTLGRLVRERKQEAETVGDAIGRAIAWMSVLFDPGAVILEGEGFARPGCLAALEQAVKRETYYRGQLPFSIQTEEGKSSSPAI